MEPLPGRRILGAIVAAALTAALALFLRWETAQHEITGAASSCRISSTWDCDLVQGSDYAKVLGVSLSTWGAAGSLILCLWLWAARKTGGTLLFCAGILTGFNLLAAAYTVYISSFVLDAFCLYCTGMHLGILVTAVLVLPPALRALGAGLKKEPLALGGLLAAAVLGLAVAGEAYATQRTNFLRAFHWPEGKALRVDTADSIVLGDPETTRHSVLLYIDFGCPYCRKCYRTAAAFLKRDALCAHFILKHFPLDRECNEKLNLTRHPLACRAAILAQALALEGHGPEAASFLFNNQNRSFAWPILDELRDALGKTEAEWEELIESQEAKRIVERDIAEGNELDLPHVPVAYVDGRLVDAIHLDRVLKRLCAR